MQRTPRHSGFESGLLEVRSSSSSGIAFKESPYFLDQGISHYQDGAASYYKNFILNADRALAEKCDEAVRQELSKPNVYFYLFKSEDFNPQHFKNLLLKLGLDTASQLMNAYIELTTAILHGMPLHTYFIEYVRVDSPKSSCDILSQMFQAFQEKTGGMPEISMQFAKERSKLDLILQLPNLQYNEPQQNPMRTLQELIALYEKNKENKNLETIFIIVFIIFLTPNAIISLAASSVFDAIKLKLIPILTHLYGPVSNNLNYLLLANCLYKIVSAIESHFKTYLSQDNSCFNLVLDVDSEAEIKTNVCEAKELLKEFKAWFHQSDKTQVKNELLGLIYRADNLIEFYQPNPLPSVMADLGEMADQIKMIFDPMLSKKRRFSEMKQTSEKDKDKEEDSDNISWKRFCTTPPRVSEVDSLFEKEKIKEGPKTPNYHSTHSSSMRIKK